MVSVMMVREIIMNVKTNQDPTSPHGSIPPFLTHRPPCIESFLVKGKNLHIFDNDCHELIFNRDQETIARNSTSQHPQD